MSWSTTFPTNSNSSFDFNFFAFNPWELYTQWHKKTIIVYLVWQQKSIVTRTFWLLLTLRYNNTVWKIKNTIEIEKRKPRSKHVTE